MLAKDKFLLYNSLNKRHMAWLSSQLESCITGMTLMAMDVFHFSEGDVVVIEVFPTKYPPIRFIVLCAVAVFKTT